MRLDEAEARIGDEVIYQIPGTDHQPEHGVISHVRDPYVFVRYDGDHMAKATHPMLLEFVSLAHDEGGYR